MSLSFADLPGEVRNKVYRLVLIHHPRRFDRYKTIRAPGGSRYYHGAFYHNRMRHGRYEAWFEPIFELSLLRVCRFIREETRSILYGENVFWFDCVPLGASAIDVGITESKLAYKGIRWQRNLVGYWSSVLRFLTPKSLHNPLRCADHDGFRQIQHIGMDLCCNDYGKDRFGQRPNSTLSLAAALRNFTQSGFSLRTAKLDIRRGDCCKPDALTLNSVAMQAALGLVVSEEIIITAAEFMDQSIVDFVRALAKKKAWALEEDQITHRILFNDNGEELDDEGPVVDDQTKVTEDDERNSPNEAREIDSLNDSIVEGGYYDSIPILWWRLRPVA